MNWTWTVRYAWNRQVAALLDRVRLMTRNGYDWTSVAPGENWQVPSGTTYGKLVPGSVAWSLVWEGPAGRRRSAPSRAMIETLSHSVGLALCGARPTLNIPISEYEGPYQDYKLQLQLRLV